MKNMHFFALIFAAVLCLGACATGKVNIPEDLTPAELIQRAQEASDRNRYSQALQYYTALLERNSTNIDLVCPAEYEIAFIYYKQKKYNQAKEGFRLLLERYEAPDGDLLPPQFRRLANIVVERIIEKETPAKNRKSKKSTEVFNVSLLRENNRMQFDPSVCDFPVYHLLCDGAPGTGMGRSVAY
jgi:tetratricopeptide (TPR) repeat protein